MKYEITNAIIILSLIALIGAALISLSIKRDAYHATCSVNHDLQLMYDCGE